MKIWLSKNSEVPVREQLVTQIKLGIASGDLAVSDRLPSTSEIARRYKIHANTVSNAYQILAEQGWLEFKKGSGFYVREKNPDNLENSLDKLIAHFIQIAQAQGFSTEEIKTRLLRYLDSQKSNKLFVVEDDEALREILIEELSAAAKFEIGGVNFEDFEQNLLKTDANFSAMFDKKAKISAVLPIGKSCVFLKARSAAASMIGETRPTPDDLIAVVSGWKNFLILAKTMLVAVKIEPESLIIRATHEENWRKGLNTASMIICDSLTAKNLSDFRNVRIFRLIAEESLDEISQMQ